MMAHLVVDCIDPELPCSLSEKAHDFAREYLKFNKIIISDDMQMGAITDNFKVEDAAVKAIAAGSDIVEYRDMDFARQALEGLKSAYSSKKLKSEQLKEKFTRIDNCKKMHLSEYNPVYIPSVAKAINSKQHQIFLDDINKKIDEINKAL